MVVEPLAQERIEQLAAEALLQELQEPGALDVGHLAQRIVRVGLPQRRHAQQLALGRQRLQFVGRKLGLVDLALHLGHLLAVQRLGDARLDVGGEAFVEPDVLPAGIGHQVARPAVRQFMGHQRHQRPVADDHGRGGEGQGRVLHAAERERGRQHQDVVAAPAIRTVQLLGGGDHLLGVDELGRGLVGHGRFGPHPGAVGQRAEHQIAGGDGQQVGRDRLVLHEMVVAIAHRGRVVARAHQHHQVRAAGDVGGVGEAHPRGVLQRHPAARVDGLGLAEHEGQLLAFGHRRRQPLQAGGFRRGVIADAHDRVALRRLHGQLAAQHLVGVGQCVLQRGEGLAGRIATFDLLDGQRAGVQHQRGGLGVFPVQPVGGRATDLPAVEIHLDVQCQVLDDHLVGLCVGTFIVATVGRVHCGRLGGGGGRVVGFGGLRAAGHQHGGGGQAQQHGTHQARSCNGRRSQV